MYWILKHKVSLFISYPRFFYIYRPTNVKWFVWALYYINWYLFLSKLWMCLIDYFLSKVIMLLRLHSFVIKVLLYGLVSRLTSWLLVPLSNIFPAIIWLESVPAIYFLYYLWACPDISNSKCLPSIMDCRW